MTPMVDEDERVALRLVGLIVVLVLGLALGVGIYKSRPTPKPVAAVAAAQDEVAGIVVENGVVKFFFAYASDELAPGAAAALAEAIQAAQAGKTLVISGYHDASGDPALNADVMNATYLTWYPNSELEVMANAGHYPMDETPVALATSIENFLRA